MSGRKGCEHCMDYSLRIPRSIASDSQVVGAGGGWFILGKATTWPCLDILPATQLLC